MYEQLETQLIARIKDGTLPGGFRLPPSRKLAKVLEVHRNTVVRVYQNLVDVGWLESVVGRGTFVCSTWGWDPEPVKKTLPAQPPPQAWNSLVSSTTRAEPLLRSERIASAMRPADCINLARLQPPPEFLPHEHLRRCFEHVLRSRPERTLGYAPRQGVRRLRWLIAEGLGSSGTPVLPEHVLVTTGSQQALDLLARVLLEPGDKVLVDEETYAGALKIFAAARAELVTVRSDSQGPDMATLQELRSSGAKALYLMPDCGNPTGRCISTERRKQLVHWSRAAGIPIIEDDYGADLFRSRKHPTLRSLDAEVLHVSTFSKRVSPALRVGFLVCPAALMRHILPVKQTMDLGTSALLQHALAEFIDRGYLLAHLSALGHEYARRSQAMSSALFQSLPREVDYDPPESGLVYWLRLPEWVQPEDAFLAAQRAGVLVTPGTLMTSGETSRRGGLRLTYCAEPPNRITEGVERLVAVLDALIDRSYESDRNTTLDMV